jgi:Mycobacterium membrane protein
MSGPNSPEDEAGSGAGGEPSRQIDDEVAAGADFPSQAYSAPESEQVTSAPYVPANTDLYDYDSYDPAGQVVEEPRPPRWPWVVGVTAILAAIALVVSVALLVTKHDTSTLATPAPSTTSAPPAQDEITTTTPPPPPPPTTEEPPPPPPPPTTTPPAGPRQVTYSVTGTKAPGDIISVTYIDASGRQRTQRNVYIPWSLTVTPISQSEVGSVQASSLFLVSRLNCSITTSDGTVLSSNASNSAQTSC